MSFYAPKKARAKKVFTFFGENNRVIVIILLFPIRRNTLYIFAKFCLIGNF